MVGMAQVYSNYIHSNIHNQTMKLLKSKQKKNKDRAFALVYAYRFTEVLLNIRRRHKSVIETLAQVQSFRFIIILIYKSF